MAITFRSHYSIPRTMAFEKEYHPNLRLSLPEKEHLLKHALTIWMLEDGKLVGETYGIPLDGKFEMPEGCPKDPEAIYCYSTTVLSKYKNEATAAFSKPISWAVSPTISAESTATPAPAPANASINRSAPN